MPEALPRRLILGYAPPLGIVLDPFGGTGTTAAAAKALGRVGISADISPAYTQLAAWRSQTLPDTVRRRGTNLRRQHT
ncbi:site-specific DNA-methyltransferase (plasmid) [Streptomyces sp. NBC_00376]|uniref:DNA methyltransferase n=1 Tax=unclassified Streptomyces TaxID=2593676 RepID=UPI002B1CF906|nr:MULTISPECIES: DNA methyltransferase [unclassified Streptomyces]